MRNRDPLADSRHAFRFAVNQLVDERLFLPDRAVFIKHAQMCIRDSAQADQLKTLYARQISIYLRCLREMIQMCIRDSPKAASRKL